MPTIEVITPGALTTVQDQGRPGFARFGVSHSGALDAFALRVANACLGNAPQAAGLEITGPGVTLRFYGDTWICVTGADLQAQLEGQHVPTAAVRLVRDQQLLRFTHRRAGLRAWLGVRGGILSPPILNSRAFDVAAAMPRQRLAAGDMLEVERFIGTPPFECSPPTLLPYATYEPEPVHRRLRYIPNAPAALADQTFTVSHRANRTGFQIVADKPLPTLWAQPPRSEPLAWGTIQVPPDGHAFVLMADRQTIGGYPVAGHLCSVDGGLAAQLSPGESLRFAAISMDVARGLAQERERLFRTAFHRVR